MVPGCSWMGVLYPYVVDKFSFTQAHQCEQQQLLWRGLELPGSADIASRITSVTYAINHL